MVFHDMSSYSMPTFVGSGDEMWDVPVVVFCVWTLVLVAASLIVISCLKRETKKFHKRIQKGGSRRDEAVTEMAALDDIMARYIRHFLNQGVLAKVASTFASPDGDEEATSIRAEATRWFQLRMAELRELNYEDKIIKRTILASLKSGLITHPMDLRGGRRALEAARIFLTMDMKKHKTSFLGSQISKVATPEPPDTCSCPTSACDWLAVKCLQFLNLAVAHPNTIPLLFAFFSFVIWFYDALTDMVIIDLYWNFVLPTAAPINLPFNSTSLSYQTLTIDLYAPLLLLILLFSLMFSLLSCSCSRLSDRYHAATAYSRPEKEQTGRHHQDATTLIGRYDFNINQASTASLLQFSLQFGSYILIIYMLEALKHDERTLPAEKLKIQAKLNDFGFSSLWFSGFGSLVSLVVAQYNGYKIQHEHSMTLSQRIIYFLACIFNTISIMTVILSFTIVLLIPVSMYVGRYHIMIIVIFIVAMLSIGFIISITLAVFGMDPLSIKTDRVIAKFKTNNLLTAFIRFSQTGEKHWATLLGATTLLGRIISLITINLFLPPSQLLIHPFHKFYATSPRSPALHYTIAKQLVYYNTMMILSSLLLCIDIGQYEFNYGLTSATKTLLIYANVTGVPCLFIAYLILFKFYTKYDLWTSNGVHLVFQQNEPIIIDDTFNEYDVENGEETQLTIVKNPNNPFLHEDSGDESNQTNVETVETLEVVNDTNIQDPVAESTVISNGDADDHNESTEADRMHLMRQTSKIIIRKTTKKINRRIKKSCLCDCVVDVADVYTKGKWLDVSD